MSLWGEGPGFFMSARISVRDPNLTGTGTDSRVSAGFPAYSQRKGRFLTIRLWIRGLEKYRSTNTEFKYDKHLMTLAPRLSVNQTDQMRSADVQLLIPQKLHETYKDSQEKHLITLADFIKVVEKKQASM